MTIAAVYVSPEGIVLGADSTSTFGGGPNGHHYFNNAQKVFEIGDGASTLGVVTWGLGGLAIQSHRRLLADLSDDLKVKPAKSVQEVVERWSQMYWGVYTTSDIKPALDQIQVLNNKKPHNPKTTPAPADMRTADEEMELFNLASSLSVGFCIGGYVLPDRTPKAFSLWVDATATAAPAPIEVPAGWWNFWGAPNMIQRLMFGYDENLRADVLRSGHWSGTEKELDDVLEQQRLGQYSLMPIRDAIDFIHSSIASTIKALKFSNLSQICGGPIEIAVITCDRPFRWVTHKAWDAAIREGETTYDRR